MRAVHRTGAASALVVALLLTPAFGRADDFGKRADVAAVRSDARVLLAHQARVAGADPDKIDISDVVVDSDQAILTWNIANRHGLMGLVRNENRWWDALDMTATGTAASDCWAIEVAYPLNTASATFDAAPTPGTLVSAGVSSVLAADANRHNETVREAQARLDRWNAQHVPGTLVKAGCEDDIYVVKPDSAVHRGGGIVSLPRSETSGYAVGFHYASNDGPAGATFQTVRVRPPTHAEFLPYPTPYQYASDAVMFFDFGVEGSHAVAFQRGSSVDVWFPFVLDDKLRYSMTFSAGGTSVGPVAGSIFDNVLHFDLPAFTAKPGETFMGEIDGDSR